VTLQTPRDCPRCGGGFPGDVPDEDVCKCGSAWFRQEGRRRVRRASKTPAARTLTRTAGLRQTGGLQRTGPISRSTPATAGKGAATKPRPKRKPDAANDIPPAVRAIVLARCQGMCESCGATLEGGPVHMHHRQKRNKRNHTPCNIVRCTRCAT
jgi:hypothetical protein